MILANALHENFGPFAILVEDKEPAKVMIRRRLKMLGLIETVGQVAFGLVQKIIHKRSDARKQEIISANNLKTEPPVDCQIIHVGSVNSDKCRQTLRQLDPQLVVVIGTRMICEDTLHSINSIFINYHAGLNPLYRGMNGGYWALANNDAENFGMTVHLVDKGVDTGSTISFARLKASRDDNITTYPFFQAAAGRELLVQAVNTVLSGPFENKNVDGESRQWFHPTIWQYLWTGIRYNVW